jgi:hypothetical protein
VGRVLVLAVFGAAGLVAAGTMPASALEIVIGTPVGNKETRTARR